MNENTSVQTEESANAAIKTLTEYLEDTPADSNYIISRIKRAVLQKANAKTINEFNQLFNCWSAIHEINEGEPSIYCHKHFDNRSLAVEWVKQIEGKTTIDKYSGCSSDGVPHTTVTIIRNGSHNGMPCQLRAQYTRSGMATSKCKVVATTNYSVLCDI